MSSITPRLVYLCSALALGSVLVAADRSSAHSGPRPNIDVVRALATVQADTPRAAAELAPQFEDAMERLLPA